MNARTGLLLTLVATASWAEAAADGAATLDELWKTRDDAETVKKTDAAIAEGLKASPEDYGLLWRASRVRWWVADGATDERLRKQQAKEGMNFAERALKVRPDGQEGHYYFALSVGAYSQAVGILKAIGEGLESKFVEHLDLSLKANTAFDMHGGLRAKGRYYWELPWPKRDLDKSRTILTEAAKKDPTHLRSWLYLAETELKDGNAKEAKAAIEKVVNGASEFDPCEARRSKAWAKPLAAKIDEALK